MYRGTGAGKPRIPPAHMAMVLLLQAYSDASDNEAVELAACDTRWQVCLDCLGEEPPFSQGALFDFRQRLIEHDLDQRLLERTVELARETGALDWKKVPKKLRVVVDSSPLRGAGRVEDTINLLAHAARKIVAHVADREGLPHELVVDDMGIPLLAEPSVKSGLDVDWTRPGAGEDALNRLLKQIDAMERWVRRTLADESRFPPLRDQLELLEKLGPRAGPARACACLLAWVEHAPRSIALRHALARRRLAPSSHAARGGQTEVSITGARLPRSLARRS